MQKVLQGQQQQLKFSDLCLQEGASGPRVHSVSSLGTAFLKAENQEGRVQCLWSLGPASCKCRSTQHSLNPRAEMDREQEACLLCVVKRRVKVSGPCPDSANSAQTLQTQREGRGSASASVSLGPCEVGGRGQGRGGGGHQRGRRAGASFSTADSAGPALGSALTELGLGELQHSSRLPLGPRPAIAMLLEAELDCDRERAGAPAATALCTFSRTLGKSRVPRGLQLEQEEDQERSSIGGQRGPLAEGQSGGSFRERKCRETGSRICRGGQEGLGRCQGSPE
jgi:hypothetical protein